MNLQQVIETADSTSHPGMARIASGLFAMGSGDFYPEERPVRKITVSSFWIDCYEVTNDQFAQFVCNRYPFNSQARKNGPTHSLSGISVPVSAERPNVTLTIDVLNESEAVVRPFPFDINPLRLSFEGRLVPNRRFADQDEFLQSFYGAERIAINYTLSAA